MPDFDWDEFDLDNVASRPSANTKCWHLSRATGRVIARNGIAQVKDYCKDCGKILSGAKKAAAIHRHTLPIIRDNRKLYGAAPEYPCDHCGQVTQLQRHHWAPWALFDDANEWPTSDLCVACHSLWHKIVTPNMRRRAAG